MMTKRTPLLLLLLLSCCPHAAHASTTIRSKPRKARDFPNPQKDPENKCRSSDGRICDPDLILSDRDIQELSNVILKFEETHGISCGRKKSEHMLAKQPVQVALALVEQMDLSAYHKSKDPEEAAAESFATGLHNTWGVGGVLDNREEECRDAGGTGILLFLSLADRVVYISKGSALNNILTDSRLDRTIDHMRPYLRQANIKIALEHAILEMGQLLHSGKPHFYEKFQYYFEQMFPFLLFGGLLSFGVYADRVKRKQERDYARVQSQLSELDRNRAEALQGRYQCTSCPICLGEFQDIGNESSRQGRENEALVDAQDHADASASSPTSDVSSDQQQQANDTLRKRGSDGLPLRLLRCGHVFDESCWNEWVESGTGRVNRCPICNQDVAGGASSASATETADGVLVERPEEDMDNAVFAAERRVNLRQRRAAGPEDLIQRAIRNYHRERAFRLMALNQRYPQYVRQDQLQRWTQSNYDGQLARDPSFVRNRPQQNTGGGRSSGGSGMSFGGGGSGGGRGGRW